MSLLRKIFPLQLIFDTLVPFPALLKDKYSLMLLNDTIKMCILLCINAIFAQLIKYEQSNCLIGILGLSSFSEMVAYLRLILDEGKITP